MFKLSDMIYSTMKDGTVKQINPFTNTEVWNIPGRKHKPKTNEAIKEPKKIEPAEIEDSCNFCEARFFNTPPEKSRLIFRNGKYECLERQNAEDINKTKVVFRRIPNLFEIVTIDYWKENYDFFLPAVNKEWKERYISTKMGLEHVIKLIDFKLKLSGKTDQDISSTPIEKKLAMADAFFGGGHELIVARKHYKEGAQYDYDLCSSGELTQDEHAEYLKFTIKAMEDIYENNRYVRYISVFQNWLKDAGASFDHLHKQMVALDEWGTSVEKELDLVKDNHNMYNDYAANFASYHNLVIAENDHAVAFTDIGHRFPTIAIYSKSEKVFPNAHTDEELRGFSDLVHACHKAMGSSITCNEEWYYTPRDATVYMPWHILIKWRISVPAGFEGGTKIYINPMTPVELRDWMVPRLYELRDKKVIDGFKIAEECPVKPNSLKYYYRFYRRY
ncbi:MAG: DUF4921 family protein [bacterium]